MHDNATHNSNATHDDADINNDSDVDDVDGDDDALFTTNSTKPSGFFFLVNGE